MRVRSRVTYWKRKVIYPIWTIPDLLEPSITNLFFIQCAFIGIHQNNLKIPSLFWGYLPDSLIIAQGGTIYTHTQLLMRYLMRLLGSEALWTFICLNFWSLHDEFMVVYLYSEPLVLTLPLRVLLDQLLELREHHSHRALLHTAFTSVWKHLLNSSLRKEGLLFTFPDGINQASWPLPFLIAFTLGHGELPNLVVLKPGTPYTGGITNPLPLFHTNSLPTWITRPLFGTIPFFPRPPESFIALVRRPTFPFRTGSPYPYL